MTDDPEKAPFTIKSFPVATRQRAVRAASKRGEPMGEWMARAAERQADLETGDGVFPPDKPDGKPEPLAGKPDDAAEERQIARMHAMAAVLQGMAAVKSAGVRGWAQRDVVATLRLPAPVNGLSTALSTETVEDAS